MIATDGRQTIANAPTRRPTASERIRQARALREAALDAVERLAPVDFTDWLAKRDNSQVTAAVNPNRGGADNGVEWNDDRCACGQKICDSPAGDKCWDCFNFDPSDDR